MAVISAGSPFSPLSVSITGGKGGGRSSEAGPAGATGGGGAASDGGTVSPADAALGLRLNLGFDASAEAVGSTVGETGDGVSTTAGAGAATSIGGADSFGFILTTGASAGGAGTGAAAGAGGGDGVASAGAGAGAAFFGRRRTSFGVSAAGAATVGSGAGATGGAGAGSAGAGCAGVGVAAEGSAESLGFRRSLGAVSSLMAGHRSIFGGDRNKKEWASRLETRRIAARLSGIPMKRAAEKYGGVTSTAVEKTTGRGWNDWFAVLDRADAARLSRKDSTLLLQQKHGLTARWSQIVAAGYEQAQGLRLKQGKPDGFEISVSRTIAAPVDRAFAAWREAPLREQWLPRTPLTIRKATPHKSIRIVWPDESLLSVNFWPKGSLKCQVVPQHSKLPSPEAAEKMKTYWSEKLEALGTFLEK